MSGTDTPGELAARAALACVGKPYAEYAAGPDAFDCTGLVRWAWWQAGYRVEINPTVESTRLAGGRLVTHLKPGDVLIFLEMYGNAPGHVGMYAGRRTMVHAAAHGVGTRTDPVPDHVPSVPYTSRVLRLGGWPMQYVGAVRLDPAKLWRV